MSETLRIAIPTHGPGGVDAPRSAHFGRSDSFTIVDVDVAEGEIVRDAVVENPPTRMGAAA